MAIEIRMRATRRMDQMRQEQKATIGLAKPTGSNQHRVVRKPDAPPTLAEAGIDKNLAHEGRKLGALWRQEPRRCFTSLRPADDLPCAVIRRRAFAFGALAISSPLR
jgi:hypothetical protein